MIAKIMYFIKSLFKSNILPLDKISNKENRILITAKNKYLLGCNLRGTIQDSIHWHEYLRSIGFDETCFLILLNENATCKAEKDGLRWLSECKGAYAIYINSSHGFKSTDGHEATLSYDFTWDNENNTCVKSIDVENILSNLDTNTKLIIANDACHSESDKLKAIPKGHSKSIVNPQAKNCIPKAISDTMLDCLYLAACSKDETAQDAFIDGNYTGAYTHFLIKNIKALGNPLATELKDKTNQDMRASGYTQNSMVQGMEKIKTVF